MTATLNEMANKLQTFIIEMQEDAHNISAVNLSKYNNIKLSMDEIVRYPHITIRIGISEATYSLKDNIKTKGGLGYDEKYARKWIENSTVTYELVEIYKNFRENLTTEGRHNESDDFAIEVDANGKIRRVYEARAAVRDARSLAKAKERTENIRKNLKNFLSSKRRKFD